MAQDRELRPLVAVVGPTGSGKSALALCLAQQFRGEIVNCDSLQLYRYLDIGTAKPSPGQRGDVPHHLFDLLDPDQVFTAGEYARAARPLLGQIAARGHLPVVVGGTGFYLRALLEGLFPGPPRSDRLRLRLARRESRHPGWLHAILARFDRASAARIHPADVQKLIRAVEVLLATREPLSAWFERGRDPITGFRALKLGLDPPRDALYERLDTRLDGMFAGGLLEEVRYVLSLGFPGSSKAFEAHGYRQAIQVLRAELDIKNGVVLAKRNTRRYAKRQWTWFRRDPEVTWLHGFGDEPAIRQAALAAVGGFLPCGT
ncbi:MAG: tRNA (adenosine(37)-N6)-dimethylallyltransferase MiaA [Bryobacteraceae bacterium]|jgi:tRNA dimethylallyltransferase